MNRFRCLVLGAAAVLALAGPVLADTGALPSSSGVIALNSLPNPSAALATANVVDAKGMVVGAVQKVVMDTGGKPTTVEVALLGSGAVVAVDASKFNYDQGHNVLTAQLDARQIASSPAPPRVDPGLIQG